MNKEEGPYDFKVMVYMNELEDLESVNDKVKVKLEEFKSQNVKFHLT